jgi:putative ATP-dependent endonuclease of the OLD family
MYLSTITLKNFRKYAYDGANKHGITVNFHKGLNALIGENDSGKSAIIDAIWVSMYIVFYYHFRW